MTETKTGADVAPKQTRAGGATVTVACKVPMGLRLRVFTMEGHSEPVLGGGYRDTKIARLAGEVIVHGPKTRKEGAPTCLVVGDYAITPGVNRDIFDKWMEDNKDSLLVVNKLVMAFDRQDSAAAAAKEHAEVRSNMEPLNGAEDARVPKQRGLKIETAERAAA